MSYTSPCDPCEYTEYEVNEFGECVYDICTCPKSEKCDKCWLEKWAKETEEAKGE